MWLPVDYWLSITLTLAFATCALALIGGRALYVCLRLLDDLEALKEICPGAAVCLCEGFKVRLAGSLHIMTPAGLHSFMQFAGAAAVEGRIPVSQLHEQLDMWRIEAAK